MTPNDIANSISGLGPVGEGDINQTMTGTQSFVGPRWTIDDTGNWG